MNTCTQARPGVLALGTVVNFLLLCAALLFAPACNNGGGGGSTEPPAVVALQGVSPDCAPVEGGVVVTIRGGGFVVGADAAHLVMFGDQAATGVHVLSAQELECIVPAAPAGTVDISITNDIGGATLVDAFHYVAPEDVVDLLTITPDSGPAAGGIQVELAGSGFVPGAEHLVTFDGVPASNIVVASESLITCTVPAGSSGAADVRVARGGCSATLFGGFIYESPLVLSIAEITPASGPLGGGTVVVIRGTGFDPSDDSGHSVKFGATPATGVDVLSASEISCVAPAATIAGAVGVSVTNDLGTVVRPSGYTYLSGGGNPIVLTSLDPVRGPAAGGSSVTIFGAGFDAANAYAVSFGGQDATNIVVVDATSLRCDTPAGTGGTFVDVVVSHPQQGSATLAGAFEYLTPPPPRTDINGDGIGDLVVATPSDSTNGTFAGAVHVYFGRAQGQSLDGLGSAQADLVFYGGAAYDGFGTCICPGDADGDGVLDLVIGANGWDAPGATDVGAAFVFRGPFGAGARVFQTSAADARLSGESLGVGDNFGTAVAIGDLDGDTVPEVLVSAPHHDAPTRPDSGCVYRFVAGQALSNSTAENAQWHYDGLRSADRIGTRIGCGRFGANGMELTLSAELADPTVGVLIHDAGEVYVLGGGRLGTSGPVLNTTTLQGAREGDRFGASTTTGDLDGDGWDELAVGAVDAYDTLLGERVGRVYIFRGSQASIVGGSASNADHVYSGLPTHTSFGQTLRSGDVDGDGLFDLLVGAPRADYLNFDNGRGYYFRGAPVLSNRIATSADAIFNGENEQFSSFGRGASVVDIDGDGFAEIFFSADKQSTGRGRAYAWQGRSQGFAGVYQAGGADIVMEGSQAGIQFGWQLAEGQ
jgi:hypothetical protein